MSKKRFEMKPEHLLLLKRMYVGWDDCEFGAPEIDPKRPYGNSDVIGDMLEILGRKKKAKIIIEDKEYAIEDSEEFELPKSLKDEFYRLHKETEIALQICLVTQKFECGIYEADEYSQNWHRIKS